MPIRRELRHGNVARVPAARRSGWGLELAGEISVCSSILEDCHVVGVRSRRIFGGGIGQEQRRKFTKNNRVLWFLGFSATSVMTDHFDPWVKGLIVRQGIWFLSEAKGFVRSIRISICE